MKHLAILLVMVLSLAAVQPAEAGPLRAAARGARAVGRVAVRGVSRVGRGAFRGGRFLVRGFRCR